MQYSIFTINKKRELGIINFIFTFEKTTDFIQIMTGFTVLKNVEALIFIDLTTK